MLGTIPSRLPPRRVRSEEHTSELQSPTGRCSDLDIQDGNAEFIAGCSELFAVSLAQPQCLGQSRPGFRLGVCDVGFKNGVVPEMIYIPRLATGGAMHVHRFSFLGVQWRFGMNRL